MACFIHRVKAGSIAGILLPAILTVLIGTSSPARGQSDPRLDEAQDDLVKASADLISAADQEALLNSALELIDAVPGSAKLYHGHKGTAATDIHKALADLKNNETPDKINQDISAALQEVRTSITSADGRSIPDDGSALDNGSARIASTTSDSVNPFGTNPSLSTAPVIPAAAVAGFTADQARAVVLITGDNADGTGFLIETPDGPAVVTNIRVIANNPNLKITTNTGTLIKMLSAKAASDRDLALLAIDDANYSYLDILPNINRVVQIGDDVVIPGYNKGGGMLLKTWGKIADAGPEQIEFNNPTYHGTSGGPVFHPRSGKVLGVVSEEAKAITPDDLNKTSFAKRNAALSGSMHYFGLRLDTVTAWVPIDWQRFQNESAFLDDFHQESRCLDSYLNSSNIGGDGQDTASAANLYHSNEKITKANDDYLQQSTGSDAAQRLQALQGLVLELDGIADDEVDQLQNPNTFYSFDKKRVQDELAYRKALRSELDSISDDTDRLRNLPKSNH